MRETTCPPRLARDARRRRLYGNQSGSRRYRHDTNSVDDGITDPDDHHATRGRRRVEPVLLGLVDQLPVPTRRPPSVSFPAADRVTVEGAIRYGSSSCNRIALDDLTYEDGTLDVTVAAASKPNGPETCTADIAAGEYTVDVSLSNGLPAEVLVTEDGFESTESHTATPS